MRYSDRLQVWFNDYYPLNNKQNGEKHIVYNRGSHGADMCAMAKRVNVMTKELPADPDLFVLEFAVNDYQGQDHKIHLDHKTDVFFEGFDRLVLCAEIVVHQLLSHYPNAAVLFLELQTAILNRKTAALLHMGVAKHYQVPVISYAETFFPDFYRLMDKLKQHDQYSTATTIHNDNGKSVADPVLPYPHGCIPSCLDQFIDPPFRSKGCKSLCVFAFRSGQRDLKCDDPLPAGREPCYVSFLAHDAVHLSAVGHQMAADLIAEAVASTARDICQFGQDLYPEQILPTVGLMVGDPKVLAEKSNFVLVKDCMEIFAKKDPLMAKTHSEGFKLYGDSVDRPGWIATNPSGGETVTFPIDLPEKRCYAIHLAILKSYEKMGTFTVTVKDLKTNQETTKTGVDGLWKPQISVPNDMQITEDDTPACTGKCTVEITTDPQIPGRTGNKVKIVTLSARECVTP
ncbi:expressed unknown protein [Seminavis robusta]|uniref:Uncharacterized protein n=1 Tax=Seminavis robusta TaxID=568900 RepID=A0A9N8F3N3_9STRA|nr:expressed unknown protein [Seminavis robusta]|eukprot:Sro3185_g344870.1 n/a (457) ;mRNA; f:3736-5290